MIEVNVSQRMNGPVDFGHSLTFRPCERCGSESAVVGAMRIQGGRMEMSEPVCGKCGGPLVAMVDGKPMTHGSIRAGHSIDVADNG